MAIFTGPELQVFKTIVGEPMTIGKIAQKVGMHRRSAKLTLTRLAERGFITISREGNRIYYHPVELDAIRKRYLGALLALKADIPRLDRIYSETKDTQTINLLKGRLGLRTALVDEIIKGAEICSFQLSPLRLEYLGEYEANSARRRKLGIRIKVLTPEKTVPSPLSQVRKTRMRGKVSVYVYSNKTTIIYDTPEITVLSIKIPEITRFFRERFMEQWKKAKPS
jgi:sugar-specific transcriptional regulator TrmB